LSSSSSQNGDQSTSKVYHIFADMVAQSGPALAEQLLKAAEASELVRQSSLNQRSTHENCWPNLGLASQCERPQGQLFWRTENN
jgi:hypothetical protein